MLDKNHFSITDQINFSFLSKHVVRAEDRSAGAGLSYLGVWIPQSPFIPSVDSLIKW